MLPPHKAVIKKQTLNTTYGRCKGDALQTNARDMLKHEKRFANMRHLRENMAYLLKTFNNQKRSEDRK